jgi:hypothetical protein
MTQLFTTNGHNKKLRPLTDQTSSVRGYMDMSMVGINDFDEVTQKLTTTAFLHVEWDDEFLSWTPASHGDIGYILLPQDDVWKPDLALQNGFTDMKGLGSSFMSVWVTSAGRVSWEPFHVFQTKCKVDILWFPFDQQTCRLKFVVWSSSKEEIFIEKGGKGIELFDFEENGEWTIIDTNADDAIESDEASVTFSMTIRRKPLYYILNIVLPVVMLSILDICVFILPAESGEKTSYAITVFLAFAVFLTIVSTALPQNSEVDR